MKKWDVEFIIHANNYNKILRMLHATRKCRFFIFNMYLQNAGTFHFIDECFSINF